MGRWKEYFQEIREATNVNEKGHIMEVKQEGIVKTNKKQRNNSSKESNEKITEKNWKKRYIN